MKNFDFDWQINEFMIYCRATKPRKKYDGMDSFTYSRNRPMISKGNSYKIPAYIFPAVCITDQLTINTNTEYCSVYCC